MKTNFGTRWLGFFALAMMLFTVMIAPQNAEASFNRGVSFQVFYDELAPYGDWVRDARHGYIWLPAVEQGFHPYGTAGHWAMTEFGNTWVSYYDWGWAPFHYGRWYFDDYFQSWAWVPGYDWGPAWVNWRTGGGYYGWAPLGPGAFINVNVGLPAFHWVFLPRHRIYHHYAYRYYAPHRTRVRIYNNTTIINNTYVYNNQTYVTGPSRREVQRVTGRNVPVYQVNNSAAPGRASVSRNTLNVYRPEIQSARGTSINSRPARVLEADQAKSVRSSRELNVSTPSRNAMMGTNNPSRTLESASRSSLNSEVPSTRTAPSRATSPSVNQGSQRPVVTPMPNESRSRSTAPTQIQRTETRQATPARSTEARPSTTSGQRSAAPASRSGSEVKRTETRMQQPTPNRGSVQQSRPAQAPARTQAPQVSSQPSRTQAPRSQAPQVNSSQQSRTQVSQPSRSQSSGSSSEVRTTAPARQSAPATPSRTSSAPSRSGERNN